MVRSPRFGADEVPLGVELIDADDPDTKASELAWVRTADLIRDRATFEAAIRARSEAGSALAEQARSLPADPAQLDARIDELRSAAEQPPIDSELVERLRRCAAAMARARRIREDTEAAAVEAALRDLDAGPAPPPGPDRDDLRGSLSGPAVAASAAVRASAVVGWRAEARWRIAWSEVAERAALGAVEPPPPEEADLTIRALRDREDDRRHAAADLARLVRARSWLAAGAVIDRPIVVLDPAGWIDVVAFTELVDTLPAGVEVSVVQPA